jgi:iron(III) transport system ATP-binding protein
VIYSSGKGVFVPPNRRGLGMVFQSYAIWPHMTVFDNAAFPLQVGKKGFSKKQVRDRVMRVLKVVALDDMADREATKLSGGQQQRLALARALVMEPPLLLLDEPLSNLDAKLRERMRFELKRLQRELGITTVYVTHDQSEALALSHSIAVMNGGRIEQLGSPREVYERPRNQFVADFVGTTNFIRGNVNEPAADGFYRIRSEIGDLKARGVDSLKAGEEVVLSIRPEDIELSERRKDGENVYQATVDQKVFLGEFIDFQVVIGGRSVQSRAHPSLRTPVGNSLYARIDPDKCVALKASGEWAYE